MQNIHMPSYRAPMTTQNDPSIRPQIVLFNSRVMANSLDVALYFGISHFELLDEINGVLDGDHGWTEADIVPVPLRVFIGGEMREHVSTNMSKDAVIAMTSLFKRKGMAAIRRNFIAYMELCEDALVEG